MNKNVPNRVNRRRRGFTLIELLIVIAILLAIGGLVAVTLLNVRDQSDIDLQRVQFDQIGEAMKRFNLDLRRYPNEEEGLAALWDQEVLEDEQAMNNWRGPYLDSPINEDMWGTELEYRFPSEERGEGHYDVVSAGPDREFGTEDDITNHDRLRDEGGELDDGLDDFGPGAPAPAQRGQ